MSRRPPVLLLPERRRGAGIYSLIVETDSDLDEEAHGSILSRIHLLGQLGDAGGFPAEGVSPAASRFRVGGARGQDPHRLACVVELENIDLYGFELLRNMCERLIRDQIDVSRVRLAPEASVGDTKPKAVPSWEDDFDEYPPVSAEVRYRLEDEEREFGKMRRCLIELRTIVEAEHVYHLADWVKPWFDVLEAGAFSRPVGPAWETDCIRGSVALFDEVSIELVVNRLQASETAWHPLINMLDCCWGAEPLIDHLLVD